MAAVLYALNQERVVTTNAWAFMHWTRTVLRVDLLDWAAIVRWSEGNPAAFRSAIAAFAGLPDHALGLARQTGADEALVIRKAGGERLSASRDELRQGCEWAPPPVVRQWIRDTLIRPVADVLLYADLRRDDRLLVMGSAWPWLAALLEGAAVVLASAPIDLLATVAEERATVLVAPTQTLAEIAFRRTRGRPDLASLRTVVATGGPLSPEGRRRLYTWVKPDLMLLARTDDTYWGSPLEPVLVHPAASPAFLTPPPSAPATR